MKQRCVISDRRGGRSRVNLYSLVVDVYPVAPQLAAVAAHARPLLVSLGGQYLAAQALRLISFGGQYLAAQALRLMSFGGQYLAAQANRFPAIYLTRRSLEARPSVHWERIERIDGEILILIIVLLIIIIIVVLNVIISSAFFPITF